jgi:hypothetical protein
MAVAAGAELTQEHREQVVLAVVAMEERLH